MSSTENSREPTGWVSPLVKYRFLEDLIENNKELLLFYLQHKESQGKVSRDYLQTVLSIATKSRKLDVIEAILLHPVDVNDENDASLTSAIGIRNAVEYAIMKDDTEMLRLLLKNAKALLFCTEQYSLLMLVIYHKSPNCQKLVLVRPDTLDYVNCRDRNGMTPLLLAARKQPSMVYWLVKNGADVTAIVRYQAHDLNIMNMLFSRKGISSSDANTIATDIVEAGFNFNRENRGTLVSEYHRHINGEQIGYNPQGGVCHSCHSYRVLRFIRQHVFDDYLSDVIYTDTTADLEITFLSPRRLRRDLFSKALEQLVCGVGQREYDAQICTTCKRTAKNPEVECSFLTKKWSRETHCMCTKCTETVMKTAVSLLLHDHTHEDRQQCRRKVLQKLDCFKRTDVQTITDILTELGPMPSDITDTERLAFLGTLQPGTSRFLLIYLYRMTTREGIELIESLRNDAASRYTSNFLRALYEKWCQCQTLKFCCKKTILQAMPVMRVNLLPLPDLLKEYLNDYPEVNLD